MEQREKNQTSGRQQLLWLVTALLLIAALFFLRHLSTPEGETAWAEEPAVTPQEEVMSTKKGAVTPYALLQVFRRQGSLAKDEIEADLADLREQDPALGELWTEIFDKMFYVNQCTEVNEGAVPSGLPQDDSLGIMVFGFCLKPDGSMAEELVARCEAALSCAQAYPNACIFVTGGPTAVYDRRTTEAGAMAQWFVEHGVSEERIYAEERSLSTVDNAVYLNEILIGECPQVDSLLIVSSSYHVPLCSLLMEEMALLEAYERGSAPYAVVSELGCPAEESMDCKDPSLLAEYVWCLAAPYMKGEA